MPTDADLKLMATAQAEIRRLRAKLEEYPEFRRMRLWELLLDTYSEDQKAAASTKEVVAPTPRVRANPATGSKTQIVVSAAIDYLRGKGSRAFSGEITRHIQARGIEVGGKNPSATLASYLSGSPLLDNVPKQGYGLKEWNSELNLGDTLGEPEGSAANGLGHDTDNAVAH